ncbi:MAG: hypothetical protein ACRDI2_11090, partial [Chloroflexota bacterium]
MVIEAFVLPYLGQSTGVVFWEPRRTSSAPSRGAPSRGGNADRRLAQPDEFAVYAPGELSLGEIAELQARYMASLGRALREGARLPAAGWSLRWWWLAGVVAAALLTLRTLEFGPGYAWLALAAAVTALPLGTGGSWLVRPPRVAVARRLARRAPLLSPSVGADPRSQERLAGLWRVARRLQGPPGQQLRELEAY